VPLPESQRLLLEVGINIFSGISVPDFQDHHRAAKEDHGPFQALLGQMGSQSLQVLFNVLAVHLCTSVFFYRITPREEALCERCVGLGPPQQGEGSLGSGKQQGALAHSLTGRGGVPVLLPPRSPAWLANQARQRMTPLPGLTCFYRCSSVPEE
jgi:hypothetical protein